MTFCLGMHGSASLPTAVPAPAQGIAESISGLDTEVARPDEIGEELGALGTVVAAAFAITRVLRFAALPARPRPRRHAAAASAGACPAVASLMRSTYMCGHLMKECYATGSAQAQGSHSSQGVPGDCCARGTALTGARLPQAPQRAVTVLRRTQNSASLGRAVWLAGAAYEVRQQPSAVAWGGGLN